MRSDNHQLPCVVCTTSNFLVYNLQLPHITSNFLMVATVMVVMLVMVVVAVMVVMVVMVVQRWNLSIQSLPAAV